MYIEEQYLGKETVAMVKTLRKDREMATEEAVPLLSEHLLEVFVNDRLTVKLACVAEHLAELVLGRLLSEGMICQAEEVESVHICELGTQARVFVKDRKEKKDSLKKLSPIEWEPEWIFRLEEEFVMDTPLHKRTSSTHSCFLAQKGKTLVQCEDMGRHNALDKAIGYGLRYGIDLGQTIAYSSGRIPTDMAIKAIRAGIPVLASKESPTREAVELAREYGLTLLCNAKNGKFSHFS